MNLNKMEIKDSDTPYILMLDEMRDMRVIDEDTPMHKDQEEDAR